MEVRGRIACRISLVGRRQAARPRARETSRIKRLSDRFAYLAARCSALDELRALLHDACRELGFEFFALLHHASLCSDQSCLLRIDNYPESWVATMLECGFSRDDPIHLASLSANAGFAWSEVGSIISLSSRHKNILEASQRFGLGDGFTVPVNVPREPSGSCSFGLRPGMAIPTPRLLCAEIIGNHAFKEARRLLPVRPAGARPHLSKREIECVRLVALGKSDWEIGVILGISPDTASQYVKRARAAYDVVSRTQLAVAALRDGWIDFAEIGFGADK